MFKMKRIGVIIILIIVCSFSVFGSSGDGMSFRINNFNLKITWTWQDDIPSLYGSSGVDLILMIRSNYENLSKIDEDLWIDYWLNEETNTIYTNLCHSNFSMCAEPTIICFKP